MPWGIVALMSSTVNAGQHKCRISSADPGHLGDVTKESAQTAMSYARSRAESLGIDPDFHAKHDIHIHVPAGGIHKDGPSENLPAG